MEATKTMTFERFSGVDNVTPPLRLIAERLPNGCPVWPLQQANNVDIDNAYRVTSRKGRDVVLTGTDIHSLWADAPWAFFVDGQTFKRLYADWTSRTIMTLTARSRMSYCLANDRVFWTNRHEIGYVQGDTNHAISDPGLEFKRPMPPGQLIEFYGNCLYVASGRILYASDPLSFYYDVRTGYKQLASDITLLRALDHGLYIGDTKIWWAEGGGIGELDRREAYEHPAIIHTDVRTDGQNVGTGHKGKVAIWTCDNGICLGDGTGQVINLTEPNYKVSGSWSEGAGMIRERDNTRHYINSLF